MKRAIRVAGARTNNLREVSCRFPMRKLSVVTGVSGSGKSSLVFDTLYAEGQRRYVQSLSTYARLFLEQMERPDVDSISDIPPAIALEQKNSIRNARSTVGTITEVLDYLRLLMTHAGTASCVDCNEELGADGPAEAAARVLEWEEGLRLLFHARVPLHGLEPEEAAAAFAGQGFNRLLIDGKAMDLSEAGSDYFKRDEIDVVLDRLVLRADSAERVQEALEHCYELGDGVASVSVQGEPEVRAVYRNAFCCRSCGREYTRPTPHLFSFNSPLGACTTCEGFGRVVDLSFDKVIPNQSLSLRGGAVAPWSTPAFAEVQEDFVKAAERLGYSTELPWARLPEEVRNWVIEGDRDSPGVKGFFKWLEGRRYKTHVRILLARYRSYHPCDDCGGQRLKPEALAVKIGRRNVGDFCALSIADLARIMARLKLSPEATERTRPIMREIRNRLAYLADVGLGYLTLARQARTLSGGEAQRIHLAAALGSALTDTLYALDEPTVGLHPRDSRMLLKVLKRLTKLGNTVVLVEHDPTLINGSDHVVEIGPGGGHLGGKLVYEGKPAGLAGTDTATGRVLLIRTIARQKRSLADRGSLLVRGARENNLDIDELSIPLGQLVCVTGVSGSGKSTLVEQVLYEGYLRQTGNGGQEAGECDGIDGFDQIDELLMMSQAPIGRSLRSNPATYLKFYDDIRKLFAATPAARRTRISAGAFSFNTSGGRCEHCQGTGSVTIEMHFMADITVPCDDCGGHRFKKRVLEVRYQDRNINDVLGMTVDEALEFFANRPAMARKLGGLVAVGLGYLALGQATSTLSGGEAQRLKLSSFLAEESKAGRTLFIFDEPTTGLHLQDVHVLIEVLDGLVERGHSVLVVEHHTDFISHADHVIDLGPEGGDGGGRVIVQGSVMDVAGCEQSHTGVELKKHLEL
ncbi:MAG: excinuclease ABC subunit UvrA [Proteobacteria bacterium]|nr:excinuclease ABC subunit UvrA [Pseudomonadota bacterium]